MKNFIALLLISALVVTAAFAQEKGKDEKEKPVTIEQLKKQIQICTELMDQKNEKDKPIVSTSTKRSIMSYMRNIERYIEQKRFYNIESQMDSLLNYQVPEIVSNELKILGKIVDSLVKNEKEQQVKAGEDLYQKVIDSTKQKDITQDDFDALNDEIETMRQEMSSASSNDIAIRRIRTKLEKASRFLGYWWPVSSAQSTGDYGQALEKLESLISSYSSYSILPTKVLRAKVEELRKEAYKTYDVEIADMRKELQKAKDSEAVRKVVNKFQVFENKYSRGLRNTTRYNEMNYIQQALNYWMAVITSEESGDFSQAIQNLRNLESGYYRNTPLLKWDEIKAKKEDLVKKMLTTPKTDDPIVKAVDEKIKECKNLNELIAFKTKLQELTNNYSSNRTQELYYLQNDLQHLNTMYNAFKSSQYAQVFQYGNAQGEQSHRWQDMLRKQRDLIRIKAIAAIADLNEKDLINEDVPANKILLNMANSAAGKKDWTEVVRILDVFAIAFFPNYQRPDWLQGEINGCKSFIAGQNYEKAGLLAQAAQQYTNVLQQTGKRLPTKEAIECLKALKESNPNLFSGSFAIPAGTAVMPAIHGGDEEFDTVEKEQVEAVVPQLNTKLHPQGKHGRK